jgi:ParB/RepB/Spo0J family partition protein
MVEQNTIQSIAIDNLFPHPDNPNRMSKATFDKLVRNIERTGKYEPLIVRPSARQPGCLEIINGHHRWQALRKLGYKTADVVVWDVDDEQVDILLATLNRLAGSDVLAKKLALLKRLNERLSARELSKLLPQTAKQIERLMNLKLPDAPAKPASAELPGALVFFVSDSQQQIIEQALSVAGQLRFVADAPCGEGSRTACGEGSRTATKAARRAAALTYIANAFIDNNNAQGSGIREQGSGCRDTRDEG